MIIEPYQPDDAMKVQLRDRDKWLAPAIATEAKRHYDMGPAFTIKKRRDIVLCLGADTLWTGVGEIWALFSVFYRDNRFSLHRDVLYLIEQFLTVHKFHRLHAAIPGNDYMALRFALSMGFEMEGVLRKFDIMGQDHIMVSRVSSCLG